MSDNQLDATLSDPQLHFRRPNLALLVGLSIVLIILALAVLGPQIAPKDPIEENLIIRVDGEWMIPPFPIFTEGFPLGSDSFGRDLYSRILWAIQPTMLMVSVVAVVRLVVGVLLGLLAGWSSGRPGRLLDTLIEASLSVPVLLVALGAIAVVGVELGIWAFIIGLSLTGWVETAQQVREQTRIIKGQVYIEAAQALGASSGQILLSHVLRQILPMVWMLFAFEVSSTLMIVAGLGFLGYYIGGDVWVEVGDFVSRRISGMPELGQMLATSWTTLTQPWAMFAVGSTIFMAVLGFNLTGEGLRQRLQIGAVRRTGPLARARRSLAFWVDQNVLHPLSAAYERRMVRGALLILVTAALLVGGGRLAWPRIQALIERDAAQSNAISSGQPAPGSQTPAAEAAAQQATQTSEPAVEFDPQVVWSYEESAGFSSAPVLSADRAAVYLVNRQAALLALDLEGEPLWQVELPANAAGRPAVASNGSIYVADAAAGLSAVSPQGELLWHFQSQAAARAISGPAVGPDGVIYYTLTNSTFGFVQAVTPDGEGLWSTQAHTTSFYRTPEPDPAGPYVYLKEDVFSTQDGSRVELESDVQVYRYFSGEDQKSYLLAGNTVIQWQPVNGAVERLETVEWDYTGITSENIFPVQNGVTAGSVAWMLYTSPGGATSLAWVTLDDNVMGTSIYSASSGQVVALGEELRAYICGGRSFQEQYVLCAAVQPGQEQPLWEMNLGNGGPALGGVWTGEHLLLALESGELLAIAENEQRSSAAAPDAPPPAASAPSEPGIVWSYQAPEHLSPLLINTPEGDFYLVSDTRTVYHVDRNGSLRDTFKIEADLATIEGSFGGSETIWPLALDDGSLMVITNEYAVNAYNPAGELLWEQPLLARPHSYPLAVGDGRVYIVDSQAGLYCFDSSGLLWQFKSEVAQRTASQPVVSPDGTVYYAVTNYSFGTVQAVSASGEGLWATRAATNSFYDPLQISPQTELVFLAEDAFKTSTGEAVPLDFSTQVDEIIPGDDGNLYMRSQYTIYQWRLGPQGVEILQTAEVGSNDTFFWTPFVFVAPNQVIWMYVLESNNMNLVWMTTDGTILGSQTFSRSWNLRRADIENTSLINCDPISGDMVLVCNRYVPEKPDPVRTVSIPGVDPFGSGYIEGDNAYILTFNGELMKLSLGDLARQAP